MEGDDDSYSLSEFFDNHHHHHDNHDDDETASVDFDHLLLQTADHHVGRANSPDDIFSTLEALEGVSEFNPIITSTTRRLVSQKSTSSSILNQQQDQLVEYSDNQNEDEDENDDIDQEQELLIHQICSRKRKNRHDDDSSSNQEAPSPAAAVSDGTLRISHITVERNRRKQMNQHLSVLRSLMPCFYVKRGDQASIIGGVVDYINELQQVLQSLEAKKQRKVYSEVVLSPRIIIQSSSTTTSPLISPRKPPLSPRLILNNSPLISPTTPQPLMININHNNLLLLSPTTSSSSSSSNSSNNNNNNNSIISNNDAANELVANSKSHIAEVEVKFSGANVLLKTVSPRIPGQPVKIISALENLSLEVLHVNISTVDQKMLNSFTVKIGIECQLSADELAQLIQQTFLGS